MTIMFHTANNCFALLNIPAKNISPSNIVEGSFLARAKILGDQISLSHLYDGFVNLFFP